MKFFIFLLLPVIHCYSQAPDWNKSSEWKLYDIHAGNAFLYSLDTLGTIKNKALNTDTIKTFLKHVTEIKKSNSPVWMGLYVATCRLDNIVYKIDVSVYGGFFYVENYRTYYELPEDTRLNWLKYFHDNLDELSNAEQ
jgi:hypothetical protein